MTIMAGIYSKKPSNPIRAEWKESLRRLFSGDGKPAPEVFEDGPVFLIKLDRAAHYRPAFLRAADGSAAMLVGEPMLDHDDGVDRMRDHDLAEMHAAVASGRADSVLRRAQGTFAAAFYGKAEGRLTLVSDKVAIRPIHIWQDDDFVIFSTAMRHLEQASWIPKVMDVRGVTENVYFGFSMWDRTEYSNIKYIKEAERIEFVRGSMSRSQYWRWDKVPVSKAPVEELADEAHRRFLRAVKRLLHDDRATITQLSGGLDSRCTATALYSMGVKQHTYNLAPANTQDQWCGGEYGKALGTHHRNVPMTLDLFLNLGKMSRQVWSTWPYKDVDPPNRTNVVFTGGGGGLILGSIYITQGMIDNLRKGDEAAVIREYFGQQGISLIARMYNKRLLAEIQGYLRESMEKELRDLQPEDPGRKMWLFLLVNDQRRHFPVHFNEVADYDLEYLQPFYNASFVELMASVPMEECLLHNFYSKVMDRFPPVIKSTPWQSYRGHVPCPLPIPPELKSQFGSGDDKDDPYRVDRRKVWNRARSILGTRPFPGQLLDPMYLRMIGVLHLFNFADYSYAIEKAESYARSWKAAEGRLQMG